MQDGILPAIHDEYVLIFKSGADTVTFRTKDLAPEWTFWIPLLTNSLVTLRPVFCARISAATLHCIRVALNPEEHARYSVKYFKNESQLSSILSRGCTYAEGHATINASKHSIFSSKRKLIEEVYDGVSLAFGSNLDYLLSAITERKPKVLSVEPIHIVSGHQACSRVQTALSLVGVQNTLVITENPQDWALPSLSFVTNKLKISRADLQATHLFIVSKEHLETILHDQERELSAFSEILSVVTNTTPTPSQVRRFFWHKFSESHPNACFSAANLMWPAIIEDNLLTNNLFDTQKRIHIQLHDSIRAAWPTFQEAATIYKEPVDFMKALFPIWSQYVTCLDIPKSLLRRIKLRVESVRPTLAESRYFAIEDLLRTTVPKELALVRLSPVVYSKDQMRDLLKRMFRGATSFAACLYETSSFHGSEAFCLAQVDTDSACSVCFESCGDQRTLTICGHSFCADCSIQVFAECIRNPRLCTTCPCCRDDVTCADLFTIGPVPSPSPPLFSKRLAYNSKTTLIDERGEIGPATSGFVVSDKYTVVSVVDVKAFVSNLLCLARDKASIKLTVLSGPKDTAFVDQLKAYLL